MILIPGGKEPDSKANCGSLPDSGSAASTIKVPEALQLPSEPAAVVNVGAPSTFIEFCNKTLRPVPFVTDTSYGSLAFKKSDLFATQVNCVKESIVTELN